MYLSPSSYNKSDDTVRAMQRMLNTIRVRDHHLWEHLNEDGIYGPATARAIKKFQEYRNISSVMAPEGPILGDTTIEYLRQVYFTHPQLSSTSSLISPDSLVTYSGVKRIGEGMMPTVRSNVSRRKFGVLELTDLIMSVISNFDDFLKQEIQYVASIDPYSKSALKRRFTDFVTRQNSKMRSITSHMDSIAAGKDSRSSYHQRKVQVRKINLLEELKKYDIIGKIEKKVASMGFVKTISAKAPGITSKIHIRGGGLLALWNYKDLIGDALCFNQWGEDEWKERIKHHFFELIDGLIIGLICTLIVNLIMQGVAAACAATVSSGVLILIAAVAVVLLSAFFTYIFNLENNSFTEKAVDNFMQLTAGIQL